MEKPLDQQRFPAARRSGAMDLTGSQTESMVRLISGVLLCRSFLSRQQESSAAVAPSSIHPEHPSSKGRAPAGWHVLAVMSAPVASCQVLRVGCWPGGPGSEPPVLPCTLSGSCPPCLILSLIPKARREAGLGLGTRTLQAGRPRGKPYRRASCVSRARGTASLRPGLHLGQAPGGSALLA